MQASAAPSAGPDAPRSATLAAALARDLEHLSHEVASLARAISAELKAHTAMIASWDGGPPDDALDRLAARIMPLSLCELGASGALQRRYAALQRARIRLQREGACLEERTARLRAESARLTERLLALRARTAALCGWPASARGDENHPRG